VSLIWFEGCWQVRLAEHCGVERRVAYLVDRHVGRSKGVSEYSGCVFYNNYPALTFHISQVSVPLLAKS
jgi:hypothetical protein